MSLVDLKKAAEWLRKQPKPKALVISNGQIRWEYEMKTSAVKKRMHDLLREAIEDIMSEQEFWDLLDETMSSEIAKASCMLSFSDGLVSILLGEGATKSDPDDFKIADVVFYTNYKDFVPHNPAQAEEAAEELRAIDNFSARVQELRMQVAANIDKYRATK